MEVGRQAPPFTQGTEYMESEFSVGEGSTSKSALIRAGGCNGGCVHGGQSFFPNKPQLGFRRQDPSLTPGKEPSERIRVVSGINKAPPVHADSCNGGRGLSSPEHFPKARQQSTADSGLGSPLDPISEHREYCTITDETNVPAEVLGERNLGRISPSGRSEETARSSVTCRCYDKCGQVLNRGNSHSRDETPLIPNGICQCNATPNTFSHDSPNYQAEAQNAVQHEQYRPKSVESSSDEVFGPGGQERNTHTNAKRRSNSDHSNKRRIYCVTGILISLVVIGFVATNYVQGSKIKKLEDKIATLEEVVGKIETIPSSFAGMAGQKSSDSRPRIHLSLKSQTEIPVNKWNKKTLQWKPDIPENGGLKYNDKIKALVVKESGTYFVYDQIYVFRHLLPSGRGMNGLSNHTMFHAIYKRPFNFPSSKQPTVVAESALSNCWDANANTQIHTSYQGVIVQLLKNEQLLVALENYNEFMDTLSPMSTFFGVFKL